MLKAEAPARRLAPEARRQQLLEVARRCMERDGLVGFTMEGVAREAGVTGPLTRHYFGTREGMLIALMDEMLVKLKATFIAPADGTSLRERLGAHLDFIEVHPWGHAVWMHAGEIHPDLGRLVTETRQRLAAEGGFGRDWNKMTRAQQLAAMGWAGYVEAVICAWIADDFKDRDAVLAVLADTAERLGVLDPASVA